MYSSVTQITAYLNKVGYNVNITSKQVNKVTNMITIEQIINREVFMNVNQLINNVVLGNPEYRGEFLEDQENMIDWEIVIEQLESEVEEEEIQEWLEDNGYESLEDALGGGEEYLVEFAEDNGVIPSDYEHEIYEYWAISDWLHGILLELGYPVSMFQGMYLMCRTTTGQMLSMDYIWQRVQERVMAVING